jgi:predicted DNA binding CopG/RHH family protein
MAKTIANQTKQERQRARSVNIMKTEAKKKRLDRSRPMTTVTIRIPEDVIEDLKKVAPLLGFSGYQPLVRAYIGQGLRADLERLDGDTVSMFIESLKRLGVSDEIIREALSEVS